jgi:2-furoyl-CoA dehydrogenase large subunit
LTQIPEGTRADYDYEIVVSGQVAAIGGRMLDGAARAVISLFFRQMIAAAGGVPTRVSWWRRLLPKN